MSVENILLDEQLTALQFQTQDVPGQISNGQAVSSDALTDVVTSTLSKTLPGDGTVILNTPQALATTDDVTFNSVNVTDKSGTRDNLEAAKRATPALTPTVIPLAKITGGGADGSITVNAEGIITAFVVPT